MVNSPRYLYGLFWLALILTVACAQPAAETPTIAPTGAAPTDAPPAGPAISAVTPDRDTLPRYEAVELTVELEAEYGNAYDAAEVRLDGLFTGPDGQAMGLPGFWDGEAAWRLRFTPPAEGQWRYAVTVTDSRGTSAPAEGELTVTPSNHHGWLQAGDWVDPAYSGHYLTHHDGTPFYGVGHADALNILAAGFHAERGVALFDEMKAAGENYVVWWPFYTNSPVSGGYDDYNVANLELIDLVVRDAEANDIYLIFTIWDHPELRADDHPWGDGRWASNGFQELSDIAGFFSAEEPWHWQENLYRYLIARWGYSPAIGMWQTVSEINGTNAYEQTNPWHQRVNDYLVSNDPYRHLTTASMSGDTAWPEGHAAMDAPQMHVYALEDAVGAAAIIAGWSERMWAVGPKPNWIGEFGVTGTALYPELFHNSIWAALAAGAALTPAEWNSSGAWGTMTAEMYADQGRLAAFVAGIPLARWNPAPLTIASSDGGVRAWGVAGEPGGLIWAQDFSLEGQPIEDVRQGLRPRAGVVLEMGGLAAGAYRVTPYDTWQGVFLEPVAIECAGGSPCALPLPEFTADIALMLERR
jgi:hypothetical protein